VQVVVTGLVPTDGDLVAAPLHVLDMEGLMEVSDKLYALNADSTYSMSRHAHSTHVQDELEGFLSGGCVVAPDEGGRLLVDGAYNAAFLLFAAVGRVRHSARLGR
jgi:hypothetical protein